MNPRMVNVDRQTLMFLPPDLREWVPAKDFVHFVTEAAESMKLSTLAFNRRGSGSEQYQQCHIAQATVDADGSMLMVAAHVITAPAPGP